LIIAVDSESIDDCVTLHAMSWCWWCT